MGFVTIRTKRRELRTGIVEGYANGHYKLSGNIEATERELMPLDRAKMMHVLEIWNRYHDAVHQASRLYEGAMAAMYQSIKWVLCTRHTHDAVQGRPQVPRGVVGLRRSLPHS